jgi:hypothetical protein
MPLFARAITGPIDSNVSAFSSLQQATKGIAARFVTNPI